MNYENVLLRKALLVCAICFFAQSAFSASTIQGTVYDKQRNSLPEIEVELLNDYYQIVNRARTDGSGRYQFDSVRDGRYTVKVYAFRYDFEDQEQPIEVVTQNIRGGEGTGFFLADFYLLRKKGGLSDSETSVVFVQDIPPSAEKIYAKAIQDISEKKVSQGIDKLNEAIQIFPNYYLALHRIGKELFIAKNYKQAVPFLIKAVETNPKSAFSLYYLGCSLHYLGKEYDKAAIRILKESSILAPASAPLFFTLGMIERGTGKYDDAEAHLLQAKKLSKNPVPEIHKELAQLYADNIKDYARAANELEYYIKASRLSDADIKQTKKIIVGLREKARSQPFGK